MILGLIWNIVLFTLVALDPHPSLDLKRCTHPDAQLVRHCWPKNGCFLTAPDAALCWRVVKVRRP